MRVNGFDGQLSSDVISGILIDSCVHKSSGYMYGLSNHIIKSTNLKA